MDSLTKHWSRLSLNGRLSLDDHKGGVLGLNKERKSNDDVVAAKFPTNRALNTEALVRTFNPIWRSVNGFKVKNVGDHIILFTFDNEEEVDKIIQSNPWGFDKHLVTLKCYENNTPVYE